MIDFDVEYNLFEFRENDLKIILDEIERGCYKTQSDVLMEVIRVVDEKFKNVLGAKKESNGKEVAQDQ